MPTHPNTPNLRISKILSSPSVSLVFGKWKIFGLAEQKSENVLGGIQTHNSQKLQQHNHPQTKLTEMVSHSPRVAQICPEHNKLSKTWGSICMHRDLPHETQHAQNTHREPSPIPQAPLLWPGGTCPPPPRPIQRSPLHKPPFSFVCQTQKTFHSNHSWTLLILEP